MYLVKPKKGTTMETIGIASDLEQPLETYVPEPTGHRNFCRVGGRRLLPAHRCPRAQQLGGVQLE